MVFGQEYANRLRRRCPQAGDKWHLDVRRFTPCLITSAHGKGYEGGLWVNQWAVHRALRVGSGLPLLCAAQG